MRKTKELWSAISFLIPTLLILIPFSILPFVGAFGLSLFEYPILRGPEFVAFENFRRLFADRVFLISFRNTIAYMLGTIPARMLIGLLFAMIVNQHFRGRGLVRTVLYFPYIAPLVSVAILWRWLMNYHFGLINEVLNAIGIASIPWLQSPDIALGSIMIFSVWKTVGWNMVVFLAALQGIPDYLYESAIMDGAGPVRRFVSITVPLLKPVFLLAATISLINASQVFEQVFVMTGGGPGYATMTIVQQVYNAGFVNYQMGYAATLGIVLFLLVAVLAAIQFRFLGEKIEY